MWQQGSSAKVLLQRAEHSLRLAEETISSSTPPEDVLSLYARRAEILMDLGQVSDAEWPLRKALQFIDTRFARAPDVERVADVLQRKGRKARAEEILKSALEKAGDSTDKSRIRLALGWSAYRAGRIADAYSIAEDLSRERDWFATDADWEIGNGINTLRVRTQVANNESEKALALADAELSRAAGRWGLDDSRTLFWVPALALSLNRAGRARDAEVVIRKILGFPLEVDTNTFGLGLSSRSALLAIFSMPGSPSMDPRTRRELWSELVRALRAQGRHVEATAMEQRRGRNREPS
jgi:tetratricopeptide (TPR) repeat protein